MTDKGRRGVFGFMQVNFAFHHKGRNQDFSVGQLIEVQLVEHHGQVIFEFVDQMNPEFIDPEKFNPAWLDRKWGILCLWSIANDCHGTRKDGTSWFFDKGAYLEGKLVEHDGGVFFAYKGLHLPLDLFRDDWEGLDYESGLGYEIEDVPRFFNALG